MPRRPPGKFTARNRWTHMTRQMQAAADREKAQNDLAFIRETLDEANLEISQFHTRAHPDCKGGCPGHSVMAKIARARAMLTPPPSKPR